MGTTLKSENGNDPKIVKKISAKTSVDIFADCPDDGNCLFWSVAFAYLYACYAAPVPRTALVDRLQTLIEESDKSSQLINRLETNIKNFFKTSNTDFVFNEDFKELIKRLRTHTVDFICRHKKAYNNYLKEMSLSGAWCGEIEITALCNLLGCDITVYDRVSNTILPFKADMETTATLAVQNRVKLELSFENKNRYSFTFPKSSFQRERRESFYALPGVSGVLNAFFTKKQGKTKTANPEDSQPDIKASR